MKTKLPYFQNKKSLIFQDEVYTLANHEKNLIKKSLEKHKGKRKLALKNLVYLKEPYIER